MRTIIYVAKIVLLLCTIFWIDVRSQTAASYDETYRPQFHFSAESMWINDPNGMVYYEGEYHLFYQLDPKSMTGGPKHWGHAVSTDLVHWQHLPIALSPDRLGDIWSGSAVADQNDTSGFFGGSSGLVAIFTYATKGPQQQSIAYSKDKGRTWIKYDGNPVVANPGLRDFRDPKVFWHEPTKKWVMILAAGQRAMIYTSPNLKTWSYASEFGSAQGSHMSAAQGLHAGVWECPDLFELAVDGNPRRKKWVMQISTNGAEGSAMQYFIGDFDGTKFTNDNPAGTVLWTDYGMDNYAAVSWSDTPAGENRRLWLGWMSNWKYADKVPTKPWIGALTLPCKVELKTLPEGIRLVQTPVKELERLRGESYQWKNRSVTSGSDLLSKINGDTLEIIAEFQLSDAKEFGFRVRRGGNNQQTTVGYHVQKAKLFVDRNHSGQTNFHSYFPGRQEAPLASRGGKVTMHIFLDRSSVEVFGNGGESLITDLIFPDPTSKGIELYADGGQVKLVSLNIYQLKSVWNK